MVYEGLFMMIQFTTQTLFSTLQGGDQSAQSSAHNAEGALFASLVSNHVNATDGPPLGANTTASRQEDFNAWRTLYILRGVPSDRINEVDDYTPAFMEILNRASAANAEADPQAFINSLSASDMDVLKHIHSMGASIDPTQLTKEGALNLLQIPGHMKDIDNDGFARVGAAKLWQFPPFNAPAGVKNAWEETTKNMDFGDNLTLQASFLGISRFDTIMNHAGEHSTQLPAGFFENFDYIGMTKSVLESAEIARKFDESWQIETRNKQIAALKDFLSHLQALA